MAVDEIIPLRRIKRQLEELLLGYEFFVLPVVFMQYVREAVIAVRQVRLGAAVEVTDVLPAARAYASLRLIIRVIGVLGEDHVVDLGFFSSEHRKK